ncbi:MAG TPA: FAD/NAD(P)-binding protein [Methylocella sp.]|nr:FAD/NAD(P)-binding protein [Methylocella sp.]
MVPRIARVRRRFPEGPKVWTLEIEEDGGAGMSFAPGQFNMLSVFGVGEIPVSMSGDASDASCIVHTIRAVGPVSAALAGLESGDILGVRGPFGMGWPMAEAEGHDVVIVAGGLGLAPLRPALYHLLCRRSCFGKAVLLYGARSPEDILFRHELDTWAREQIIDAVVTVDHARSSWNGHAGAVTTLIPRAGFDPKRAIALVCGPEVMMRFAITALRSAGVSAQAIYLSMERNMKCAAGLCGRCQFGPVLVCRDGPVFRFDSLRSLLAIKEL